MAIFARLLVSCIATVMKSIIYVPLIPNMHHAVSEKNWLQVVVFKKLIYKKVQLLSPSANDTCRKALLFFNEILNEK